MRELDTTSFDDAIAGEPLLVDFWAPWCRPCKALEPVLADLETTVPVAKLNIDDHPSIGARYDVLSIPTVVLFARGERISSIVGIRPKSHFDEWLREVLPAAQIDVDA
ncbi:MAG TPA: thioredoxin family protein [Gaiellaceae bacterium]|jgi:thioredoxin